MELLAGIALILLAAFLVGGIARFAVPGPDPMPVWMTIAIGLSGALVGAFLFSVLGLLVGGAEEPGPGAAPTPEEEAVAVSFFLFLAAVVGATLVLVAYRKLVQRRPITGPEAQHPPLRPRGLRRVLARRPHRYLEETADPDQGWAPGQLQKLVLLKEAGEIDEAEYERRKAALVDRL